MRPVTDRLDFSPQADCPLEIRAPPAWWIFLPDGRFLIFSGPTNGRSMARRYSPRPRRPRRRSAPTLGRRIMPQAQRRLHVPVPSLRKKSATGPAPQPRLFFSREFPSVSRSIVPEECGEKSTIPKEVKMSIFGKIMGAIFGTKADAHHARPHYRRFSTERQFNPGIAIRSPLGPAFSLIATEDRTFRDV